MEDYAASNFPVEVGPEWSLETIRNAIGKGTHSSTPPPESTAFCRKEILERTQQGFGIFLLVTNSITLFGTALRISHLASVDFVNRKTRLIYNFSKDLDAINPLVNASSDKGTTPNEMKFGLYITRILQKIGTLTRRMAPYG